MDNKTYWDDMTALILAEPDEDRRSALMEEMSSGNEKTLDCLRACVRFALVNSTAPVTGEHLGRMEKLV